eukprot:jgi/Botrbrau1/12195/Bobra.0186s0100.2
MPEGDNVEADIRHAGNESIASAEEANAATQASQRISGFANFRGPSEAQQHESTDTHKSTPGFSFSSYKPPPDPAPAAGQDDERAQREAALIRAADFYLPSSSESESESGEDTQRRGASPGGERSDGSPRQSKSRVYGRQKQRHKKKRKRKDSREPEREPSGVVKRPKTDAEKVAEIEARIAKEGLPPRRAAVLQHWWGDEVVAREPFYFDSRGDPDNVTYEGVYRFHVPNFHRADAARLGAPARGLRGSIPVRRRIGAELDSERQKEGARGRNRFFLASTIRRANQKQRCLVMARSRAKTGKDRGGGGPRLALPAPAFIPMAAGADGPEGPPSQEVGGEVEREETPEEYARRRTVEFNVATRERPHDLQLWLDFATFQDELAGAGGLRRRRTLAAGVAEKKIAILEAALQHHPGSDHLLLALLDAAKGLLDNDELQGRWRRVLQRYSGSGRLWTHYLAWRKGEFREFLLSDIRDNYAAAMRGLAREVGRRKKEGAPQDVVDEAVFQLVGILAEAGRLELQSGNAPQCLARVQAALEFHFFSPPFPEGEAAAKLRCFENFWNSGDPMIGEEGAIGWAAWQLRHMGGLPDQAGSAGEAGKESDGEGKEEEDPGGWTGWEVLPEQASLAETGNAAEGSGEGTTKATEEGGAEEKGDEEEKEEEEEDDDKEASPEVPDLDEETEEELMARLGMKLEAELEALTKSGGLPADVAAGWAQEERCRDAVSVIPSRKDDAPATSEADTEEAEDSGATLFDDVCDCLFVLDSDRQRQYMLYSLLELLGVPLGLWRSTNDPRAAAHRNASDCVGPDLADALLGPPPDLATVHLAEPNQATDGMATAAFPAWLKGASGGQPGLAWFQASEGRRAFVARLLTALFEGPCKDDRRLAQALLAVESATTLDQATNPDQAIGPDQAAQQAVREAAGLQRGRDAAQALLSRHQASFPLWAAYAALLERSRQLKATRKVYEKVLGSLLAVPKQYKDNAGPLALALSRLEKGSGAKDASLRALHPLVWLATGGPFAPLRGTAPTPDPSQLVEARRGFQRMLSVRMAENGGVPDEASRAVIEAAAEFERLLAGLPTGSPGQGLAAAHTIFQNAIDASPPEVRRESGPVEQLHLDFCLWLEANLKEGVTPARLRNAVLASIKVYPRNVQLWAMLARLGQRAHAVARVRRELREAFQETGSTGVLLLAALHESSLRAESHHMQGGDPGIVREGGSRKRHPPKPSSVAGLSRL